MPTRATIVVGANFGDEGKGRMVDFLATGASAVCRFNGGAQAGHTVEADGVRHVFSHFGSGTLKGAATILSRFFVANPVIFANEFVELKQKGAVPHTFIDPRCPLTTPYEVAVNRAIERARGGGRHGSCGVGFGETLEREEQGVTFPFGASGGFSLAELRNFAEERLRELGLSVEALELADEQVPAWSSALEFMRANTAVTVDTRALRAWGHVVFEGAQGLLLDEESKFFPHVTRSKTGIKNAMFLADNAGIADVEAVYMTRSYLTRHGAGPLPNEDRALSYPDETNVDGEFQGSLRFAPLDLALLAEAVRGDIKANPIQRASVAVTCMDQEGGPELVMGIEERVGLPVSYVGYGPQRQQLMPNKVLCE